jgi:tetratricopeptide (TPR) repeat protein
MDFGLARALDREAPGGQGGLSVGAGTAEYMAPELLSGSPPTIRSDIFAFGRVAQQLLPSNRLWDECTQAEARQRPASLEPVLRHLHPGQTRRKLLAAGATAAVGAIAYAVWPRPANTNVLPGGARVLVNGFSSSTDSSRTRLARSLLLTALQQSPRLRAIADRDLLPAINSLQAGGRLPVTGTLLGRLLEQLRAAYWVEGSLDLTGSRYSLRLRIFRASDQRLVIESAFRDRPSVLDVVQQAALWLRTAGGESERSLALNPVTVATYTSKVPEALEKYYDAMERSSLGDMDGAIPLLEEAVRLDPGFAQAHHILGMALFPKFRYERSFREMQIANSLSGKLPEREKAWLLTNYYAVVEDPAQAVLWATRNKSYYPDDPRCLRTLARILCWTGDAPQSIEYSRKVLDLTPESDLARKDLIDNLCQAGDFEQALAEYQVALNRTVHDQRLHRAGVVAFLGLERYAEARAALLKAPESRDRTLDLQRVRVMEGEFTEALSALNELSASAKTANDQDPDAPSPIEIHQWNEFLCGTYFLCDRTSEANRVLQEMADLPAYPTMARRLDCVAFWAFRLGNLPVLNKVHDRLAEIRKSWDNDFTRTVERHAQALLFWSARSTALAERSFLDASDRAFSPWRLFDAATFFTSIGRPERAMDYWENWAVHRGMIIEFWFPGVFGLEWLNRAVTLQALNRRTEAHRFSQKVLDHWSHKWPAIAAVQAARNINLTTKF